MPNDGFEPTPIKRGSLLFGRESSASPTPEYAHLETVANMPPETTATATVEVHGSRVRLELDASGQHTLSWLDPTPLKAGKTGPGDMLPPGSCNLYTFPRVQLAGESQDCELEGARLQALMRLLLACASDTSNKILHTPDGAGAYPLHGLIVCNTKASLEVGLALFRRQPTLLLQQHQPPIFTGENNLHIVIVNRHEDLLLELINLAIRELPATKLPDLFLGCAEGVFFEELPMRHYGGTPLGYAAVFGMRKAILTMLSAPGLAGFIDLNSPKVACKITGFLPIHAVTANGLGSMIEFLCSLGGSGAPCPEKLRGKRGDIKALTAPARMNDLADLTAMQVSVKLGDDRTFKKLIRRQTTILWRWGPVTQYRIDLDQIDSAGAQKGEDVMELVGAINAPPGTTNLIMDNVLNGFMWELFELKWSKFTHVMHWCFLALDLAFLAPLALVTFHLKTAPEDVLSGGDTLIDPALLPHAVLVAGGLTILPEIVYLLLYVDHHYDDYFHKQRCGLGAELLGLLAETGSWLMAFHVHLKVLSVVSGMAGCWLLLSKQGGDGGSGVEVRRLGMEEAAETLTGSMEFVLALLGLAVFTQISYLMNNILTPFRKLGVFMLTVNRMLRDDIMTFLVLFGLIFVAFYSMLFTVYPRYGDAQLPQAAAFNDWAEALEALIHLSFMGEPPAVEVDSAAFETLSMPKQVNYGVFLAFYTFFILVGEVLLLNLLIAMLSNTFAAVQKQQVLEWRLERARRCLRVELIAGQKCLLGEEGIRIGEKQGPAYYYPFRHVSANIEGVSVGGNIDLFDDLDADEDGPFAWKQDTAATCESMGGFKVPAFGDQDLALEDA